MKNTHSLQYMTSLMVLVLSLTMGLYSCDLNNSQSEYTYAETDITLKVKAVGNNAPFSRKSSEREMRLDNIALLVFEKKAGVEVFSYRAEITKIEFNSSTQNTELNVKLRKSLKGELYTLVLIANHDLPSQLGFMEGIAKDIALASITFMSQGSESDYIWSNINDKAFPMWGELNAQSISDNSTFDVIYLLRALAKIDVGFNYQVTSDGQESHSELNKDDIAYSLESIHLYRSRKQGRTTPDFAFVNNAYAGSIKVGQPSLIDGDDLFNPPILFKDLSTTTTVNKTLYLAENAAGLAKDTEKTTSLVLGIKHPSFNNTENGEETHTRYFRADIANASDYITRPILRNHRYVVGIDNITGIGSETPEEADKGGREVLITVSVTDWSIVDSDLIVNGEQKFYISQRQVVLESSIGSTHLFDFDTNLPKDKVKIEVAQGSTAEEYLTINLDFDTKRIKVDTKKANSSGQPMKHTFIIRAGRMNISMKVEQK